MSDSNVIAQQLVDSFADADSHLFKGRVTQHLSALSLCARGVEEGDGLDGCCGGRVLPGLEAIDGGADEGQRRLETLAADATDATDLYEEVSEVILCVCVRVCV
jgi:hypothetical protein